MEWWCGMGVDHVAFLNANGRRVIFSNSGAAQQSLVVKDRNRQFTVTLPATSVTTIVWE